MSLVLRLEDSTGLAIPEGLMDDGTDASVSWSELPHKRLFVTQVPHLGDTAWQLLSS